MEGRSIIYHWFVLVFLFLFKQHFIINHNTVPRSVVIDFRSDPCSGCTKYPQHVLFPVNYLGGQRPIDGRLLSHIKSGHTKINRDCFVSVLHQLLWTIITCFSQNGVRKENSRLDTSRWSIASCGLTFRFRWPVVQTPKSEISNLILQLGICEF